MVEMKMRGSIDDKNHEETRHGTSLRIVAYLDGGSEPTTHAMKDISVVKDEFEKWGGKMTFIFKDEKSLANFKMKQFNELPKNISVKIDEAIPSDNLPIFMILNEKEEKVFEAKGYQIGLGEQLLKALK